MAGNVTLTAAARIEADAVAGTIAGNINTNGNTLTLYANNAALNVSGNITGAGGVTNIGGNSTYLSGSNSYSSFTTNTRRYAQRQRRHGAGGWLLNAGVVNFSGTQTVSTGGNYMLLSVGTFNITGGSLNNSSGNGNLIGQSGGTAVMNVSGGTYVENVSGDNFYIGNNGGNGTLTVSGSGLVVMNYPSLGIYLGRAGSSSVGTLNLNGGTLATGRSIRFQAGQTPGTAIVNFNGGTLEATAANSTWVSNLTSANVQNGGAIINTNGYSMGISQALAAGGGSTGGLTVLGGGMLTLSGSSTYAGATTVSAGTLQYGAVYALPSAGAVNVSGNSAVLDLNTFSPTVGAVTLTAGSIQNGTLSGSSFSVQSGLVSANLAGSGATLTQTGGGLVTLSGNNTYGGSTSVSGGTLVLSNASGNNIANSPAIALAAGATLDATHLSGGVFALGASQALTGFGTVNGGVTTAGTLSAITPGAATGNAISIGTLSTGNLNLAAGASLNFVLAPPARARRAPGWGA